jgi:hypothetical protein
MHAEDDGLPFPYRDREDILYFDSDGEDSDHLKQRPDVDLYRRFPWLEFKNPRHKKTYVYLGRDTEHARPFFLRFNLKQEIDVGSPELAGEAGNIDEKLRQAVQGVAKSDGQARDK